jgi:glycolate oxidase iron-sulfur subunit
MAQTAGTYPPLDESRLPPIRGEVAMLEGCAMRVLFPRVNEATRRLLRRVGYTVQNAELGCCGALHAHNGYLGEATEMRMRLLEQVPANLHLVVNSAGCGAWLKEELAEVRQVLDVSEFLLKEGLAELLASQASLSESVTYHDACHLAHGQGIKSPPRELIMAIPGIRLVEMLEADMCCGSAGIYNVTQPQMARKLLERKWANIEATGAKIVAMGNPGCHSWIAQAAREQGGQVEVLHTSELLERAF